MMTDRQTDRQWMLTDNKSSHGLWPGELKKNTRKAQKYVLVKNVLVKNSPYPFCYGLDRFYTVLRFTHL